MSDPWGPWVYSQYGDSCPLSHIPFDADVFNFINNLLWEREGVYRECPNHGLWPHPRANYKVMSSMYAQTI